jgi:threonine dehydrogenase-like Zn-dependent dehydrogenase
VLDPAAGRLRAAVGALCPGGADKLIETSGAAAAHAAIPGLLRPEGEAAIVGMGTRELSLKLSSVLSKQLRIFGSSLYPSGEFGEILEFVRRKRVPIGGVVTHEMGLEDAPAGFRLADSARSGKVVFRLD